MWQSDIYKVKSERFQFNVLFTNDYVRSFDNFKMVMLKAITDPYKDDYWREGNKPTYR
jgi:hypothetical protein